MIHCVHGAVISPQDILFVDQLGEVFRTLSIKINLLGSINSKISCGILPWIECMSVHPIRLLKTEGALDLSPEVIQRSPFHT